MRGLIVGMLAACLIACAAPGVVRAEAAQDLIEQTATGKINWTTGWVRATGVGVPPPNVGGVQARAMAERAAFAVALRNLLETVKGIRVDSKTLVENYMVSSDVIKTQVSGFVKAAQVDKDKTVMQPDGTVELTVKAPLWGAESLIAPMMSAKGVEPRELGAEPDEGNGSTGLIIDARGLGVLPACFPEVLDENGAVLYGPDTVDRLAAEKDGAAKYITAPKDANLSSLERAYVIRPVQFVAGPASVVPREGRRPLRIKGLNKTGVLKANILISHDDAEKIKGDPHIGGALRRSRVTIVTDPLIGGTQGRLEDGDLFAGMRP
ncbi:MAG TPA: hypothetical protein VFA38_08690 [Nitrospirales bacterium]|nr:hypothetical protein [Nitrospirales bacterium]